MLGGELRRSSATSVRSRSLRFMSERMGRRQSGGVTGQSSGEPTFKRLKCVVVIMSVCCLHFVFLTIYFSINILHLIYVTRGIEQSKLKERYLQNLTLRALFVLQASLNPLLLFRIRSFRTAFRRLIACATARSRNSASPAPNTPTVTATHFFPANGHP